MTRLPGPVELNGPLVRPYIRAANPPKPADLTPVGGLRGLIVYRRAPRNGDHK